MKRKVTRVGPDLQRVRARGAARAVLLVALAALALAVGEARGQEPDARAAQAGFERFRVARLPWSMAPGGGPCDEVVGRFCYWHEGGEDRPVPPEPEGVAAARDSLLVRLDAAARRAPGDGWVLGQRIRYRIEAGRPGEAAAIARACGADPWWCAALEGAALHAAGDPAAAERAFDRALAAMPAADRERWTDLAPLLDPDALRIWEGLGPGGRAAFARRVWWAADPLWSTPGNERRAEHLYRRAWDRMQEGAASAFDVRWGPDLAELLVRYGWPVGWERSRDGAARLGGGGRPGVVAHDPPGAKRFVPTLAAIADPAVAGPAAWPLDDPAPKATYAPARAPRFLALDPQVARFRRGTETLVVAGWALADDSLPAGAPAEAALFAAAGPDAPFRVARAAGTAAGGALGLRVAGTRAVIGVEALAAGVAGRWRSGLPLPTAEPGLPAVSDLLLLDGPGPQPVSLEEALPRARPSSTAAPGERLGVYWELYPPPGAPAGPVTIALALRETGAGLGTRLARVLRLADGPAGAELRWSETLPAASAVPRAVDLRLPDLPPGRYELELAATWPEGRAATARREIEVLH